ncbi:MAG: polysaccharide biosynthesis transport protein [Blastocatellia bacterium]|jgi:capsular exopolysaccharide synthesis family protein|nr:polysaccharide biosynthesis transport protein [Blastocatellia bacterium]
MSEATNLVKREEEPGELTRRIEEAPAYRSPGYGYGGESDSEGEVHLLDYWRAIRKRLWLVIGVAALMSTLATIYVARKPDIYEASARVEVDLESNPMFEGKSAPVIYNQTDDPVYFNTQLQILSSTGLLRRVVKTLDLEHNQAFLRPESTQPRSTWKTIKQMWGLSGLEKENPGKQQKELPLAPSVALANSGEDLDEARRLAPYVRALQGGLRIEPVHENRAGYDKQTRLIDITYTHGNPDVATKITNAVAETFVRSNLEKKNENTASTSQFLSQRVAELQSQIRADEEKLGAYAKSNQILSLDSSQNTVVDRLSGLNKQLLEAENDRKMAEAAYNAATAPGAASALAEAGASQINDAEQKLADLKQKRAQLLVDATEEAPEVKEVNQQIAEVQKHLNETRTRNTSTLLTNLETKYRQTLSREQALRTSFNQQKGETVTQNEAAINYRILQQEIQTNKGLLENLLQKSKENDVVLAGRPNNILIVDKAISPDFPVGPARMRSVLMALVLGLALGVGLALFLEYLDDTIHSSEDVEKFLRLPALVSIPRIGTSAARRRLLSSTTSIQKQNGNNGGSPELLMNVDGRSSLAEAYRQLRTSVLLSTAGHVPRSLLVTSSMPGEGKTTTAVNTAVILAQTGASVVIIDADMRRPRLRSIFGLSERAGLSSILSTEVSEAAMLAMISSDEGTGLQVLTAGPIPPNPAELLGSDQMRRLMTVLQSQFTHVVVDSPPVSAFTDGVLIASMVDGVLLVVHGGKSSRQVVRRSRQLLNDVGAKVIGVVLNNVDRHAHDDSYYQHYYAPKVYRTDADDDDVEPAARAPHNGKNGTFDLG